MNRCSMTRADPTPMVKRKPYLPPVLVNFGAVRNLTQAGSAADFENGNPGNCSQNARKPCK